MQTFWQITPRYTAGSPAQITPDQAEYLAAQESRYYDQAIRGDGGEAEAERAKALGTDGIVECISDFPDGRRQTLDLITGRVLTTAKGPARPGPSRADALAADLKILARLFHRRGGAWIRKWASHQEVTAALKDPAYADYVDQFPNCIDPRD